MSIRDAKLRGIRAAAEAHEKLGILAQVREGLQQIDVFSALNELNVPVVCKPLQGLLGAYVSRPYPGILISTNRRLAVQRFTAAHEFGHYWLKHGDAVDSEESLKLVHLGVANVPEHEVEAESFASEFLLPKLLIYKTMVRHRWSKADLRRPSVTYQLSLRLGVSYEAMWRALLECEFISMDSANFLKGVTPKQCKTEVLQEHRPVDSWSDAFHVTETDNDAYLIASKEDTVVLDLPEHYINGYKWTYKNIDHDVEIISNELIRQGAGTSNEMGIRRIVFRGEKTVHIQLEEKNSFHEKSLPLKRFGFSIDFNGKEVGLSRAARS